MVLNIYVSKTKAIVFDRKNGVKDCKLHTNRATLKLTEAG